MEEMPFWERSEIVERFAARDPDHRLVRLVEEFEDPRSVRVLDLGCAGGRNSVFLTERGFDLVALDASRAMVDETRRRLTPLVGAAEAERRVVSGSMTDLSRFPDRTFDLVVALGVHHTAPSREAWGAALDETARVTKVGGRVLVASFTDECDPQGTGLRAVPGEPHVYERDSGRCTLVSADRLDEEFSRRGLEPAVPTEVVRRPTDAGGRRVTANALYCRRPPGR